MSKASLNSNYYGLDSRHRAIPAFMPTFLYCYENVVLAKQAQPAASVFLFRHN